MVKTASVSASVVVAVVARADRTTRTVQLMRRLAMTPALMMRTTKMASKPMKPQTTLMKTV